MNMKIPEFGSLQMVRTDAQHFGRGNITQSVNNSNKNSFQDYLFEAVNSVNSNQLDVNALQEKMITNPDDVDIHDVTIAMSKARMSLNLAQSVIDRLITGWNEITTTR